MLKKINLLLSAVFLVTQGITFAQGTSVDPATIKGSPYVEDAYTDGVIYYGDKSHSAPMRYNAFQDLIEFQQNGKAVVLDPSNTVKRVVMGKSVIVPLKYESNGKSKLGYFTLLDSGKVMLFAKKKIIYLDAKKGGALDGGDLPAQYKRSPDSFYYKTGDGDLQEADNIKSMISNFPDKKDELTQYAKKEKISVKKEKELIQFVQYYNSLN
ncbi:MAG: hypothetical protein C0490_17855 [Marivirga sp.]|nr:hypothetical protein [Marivirga sp.]